MLKRDVRIGQTYRINHTSGRVDVRITGSREVSGYGVNARQTTRWDAVNLKTGRTLTIKSAAKLQPLSGSGG